MPAATLLLQRSWAHIRQSAENRPMRAPGNGLRWLHPRQADKFFFCNPEVKRRGVTIDKPKIEKLDANNVFVFVERARGLRDINAALACENLRPDTEMGLPYSGGWFSGKRCGRLVLVLALLLPLLKCCGTVSGNVRGCALRAGGRGLPWACLAVGSTHCSSERSLLRTPLVWECGESVFWKKACSRQPSTLLFVGFKKLLLHNSWAIPGRSPWSKNQNSKRH